MKKIFLPLGMGLLLFVTPSLVAAFGGDGDVTPLNNKDVLQMVLSHQSEETIINTIKTSPCTFDTFPPVLKDMKRRGVSDAVLQAMIDAPYGPSSRAETAKDDIGNQPIYHYIDQLRQMGYVAPTTSRQTSAYRRQDVRARNTRTRTRTRM